MVPDILKPYLQRKVRVVAAYGEPELWALIDLLTGGQTMWAYEDYQHYYMLVTKCELPIADWTAQLQESKFDPCS